MAPGVANEGDAADGRNGGWLTKQMAAFLTKLSNFFEKVEDVNCSDLDLCEFNNQTVMYFNWGEQHYDNGIALAVANMPLTQFLQGFF